MFWELAPGDAIGKPVKLQCPKIMNAWKSRKHKMEKASRVPCIEYEHSPRDAFHRQVFVLSKAVFSYAMTLMDNFRWWEDEERWVGSKIAACMWTCTKEALTGGQIVDREQEEYLKKRVMSFMLCTNWVCAGTFVDHELVSSRTIIQQDAEFLKHGTEIENGCSVRGTRESIVVFSTYEFEPNFGT